jgi:hypothetical protein
MSKSKELKKLSPTELERYHDLKQRDTEEMSIKVVENGSVDIADGLDSKAAILKLNDTFGTETSESAFLLLSQVAQVASASHGGVDETVTNQMVSLLNGIKPRDNVEAMLAAQMVATHKLAMDCASSAHQKDQPIKFADMRINQMTKLTRSFTTQMAALDKYRGKGQQKMTVEHVHINDGGQAVIGNVEGGGGR